CGLQLRASQPAQVIVSVSPFGQGNSLSGWQASDAVLHALSGELSRSGIRGREPLLPPGQLAWQCAAVQAAFLALQSYFLALRT
ncbi:acyl-CoA hydratase, partial [Enterococcus faecium]